MVAAVAGGSWRRARAVFGMNIEYCSNAWIVNIYVYATGICNSFDIYYQPMINCRMHEDYGLTTLIDLDGQIIEQGGGYWIKLEAWRVPPTNNIPHGIRYSLTLHEPYGKRILGYDNAHAVKLPKKFKFAGQRLAYDHKHCHVSDKGVPYEFRDAQQLLVDFFAEVDRVLQELRQQ